MNVIATFTLTKEYFSEDLHQWIRYVSKGRKYEPFLGGVCIVIGTMLLIVPTKLGLMPFFSIGIGVFESIRYVLWKRKWLQARMASSLYNKTVELVFSEHGVRQIVPENETLQEWSLSKFVMAQKGIFLYSKENANSHVYIPNAAFKNPDDKNAALALLNAS
jgi:hypothetical protein